MNPKRIRKGRCLKKISFLVAVKQHHGKWVTIQKTYFTFAQHKEGENHSRVEQLTFAVTIEMSFQLTEVLSVVSVQKIGLIKNAINPIDQKCTL